MDSCDQFQTITFANVDNFLLSPTPSKVVQRTSSDSTLPVNSEHTDDLSGTIPGYCVIAWGANLFFFILDLRMSLNPALPPVFSDHVSVSLTLEKSGLCYGWGPSPPAVIWNDNTPSIILSFRIALVLSLYYQTIPWSSRCVCDLQTARPLRLALLLRVSVRLLFSCWYAGEASLFKHQTTYVQVTSDSVYECTLVAV